ncbi:TolC family protein [Pelodictyon luteolum]|nr:TolC family protein [Pelodictyon luteolum]
MNRTFASALILLAATTAGLPLSTGARAMELTLDAALSRMDETSPALRSAREGVNAADAGVEAKRSGWFPEIAATATYGYHDRVSQFDGMQFMPNDSYDARISASMMLFDFGRTAKSVTIATSGRNAAGYRLALTQRDLSWATIQIFYDMLFLREAIGVQEKEITALEKNLDVTMKRYREGVATRFDLLSTEVRLASAKNRKLDLETELANQEISLRRLAAIADGEPLELKGSFSMAEEPSLAPAPESEALQNRLEVKLATEHARAAREKKSLAGRQGLPKITGSVSWGSSNGWLPDSDPDLGTMRTSTTAGLQLELPLFTGFRTAAGRREALAMQRAAEQDRIEAEQRVRAEVRQTSRALKTSREKITTTALQVEQARLAAENARIRHMNGLATTLDLLDTEASLAGAELGNLQARYAFVMNTYAFRKASGMPLMQEPSIQAK